MQTDMWERTSTEAMRAYSSWWLVSLWLQYIVRISYLLRYWIRHRYLRFVFLLSKKFWRFVTQFHLRWVPVIKQLWSSGISNILHVYYHDLSKSITNMNITMKFFLNNVSYSNTFMNLQTGGKGPISISMQLWHHLDRKLYEPYPISYCSSIPVIRQFMRLEMLQETIKKNDKTKRALLRLRRQKSQCSVNWMFVNSSLKEQVFYFASEGIRANRGVTFMTH